MLRTLALHDRSWPFRFDLRAETPVVPLRLRNLEAVTGEEDEGPSEGLVKPWGRFTEVRFNLFRCVLLTGPPLGEGEGWSLLEGRGVSEPDKQVNYCKGSL